MSTVSCMPPCALSCLVASSKQQPPSTHACFALSGLLPFIHMGCMLLSSSSDLSIEVYLCMTSLTSLFGDQAH